jgi:hypothetical protein
MKRKSKEQIAEELEAAKAAEAAKALVALEEAKKTVKEEEDDKDEDEVTEEEDGEDEEEVTEAKKAVKEEEDDKDEEEVTEEDDEEDEKVEEEAIDYKADLDTVLEETEGLTEEFKGKASTIFEAAFTAKVRQETQRLDEDYEVKLIEETEKVREDLVEKIDAYLDHAVAEWLKENEVAIDAGLKTELSEDFMTSLKAVFEEHYIEVPESKVDLYEAAQTKLTTLEEQTKTETDRVAELEAQVETLSREKVLADLSEGLATTQSLKLMELTEDIEFTDLDTFTKKVTTIRETFFKDGEVVEEETQDDKEFVTKTEIVEEQEDEDLSPSMQAYGDALGRAAKYSK